MRKLDELVEDQISGRIGRREFLRRAALLGIAGPMALNLLAACTSSENRPAATDSGQSSSSTPKYGGEVHIGSIQEPDGIFPYANTLAVGTDVYNMIFDSLLELNDKGEYQPKLATQVPSVENGGITADGLKYTFKLRNDVKWHDGAPLTSKDVKFTWQTVTDPKFPVQNRISWAGVANVETPDDQTAVITRKSMDVAFSYYMATTFILPSHLLQGVDIPTSPYFRKPVGTGPFKFDQWQSGTAIRVVKNPNYWKKGQPYLDAVVYETIPSTEGLLSKLQRQELHLRLALNFTDQDTVRKFDGYKVTATPSYSIWNMRFNNEDPILSDVKVRQALAYAINKDELSKGLMKSIAQPLWTWVTESHWAHNPNVMKFQFNPDKAKQLLEEAGWKDQGAGGPRQKDGEKLSLLLDNIAGDAERLQLVQICQQYWKAVGVETVLNPIQAAAFGQRMEEAYQISYNFAGHDFEVSNTFWLRQPRNWPRYRNDAIFDLMRKANATLDREERKKLHLKWQELIVPDQPEVPLFARVYFDAIHNTLHNYKPVAWGRPTWNADEWWLG